MNTATQPDHDPRHSIAVVSRRTGLSQLVLRAWERRYAVVAPGRTESGRRRYSDLDVERLSLLGRLTAADHRIGDIANLPLADLRQLVDELPVPAAARPVAAAPVTGDAAAHLERAMHAVAALDPAALEGVLSRASLALGRTALRQDLIQPLLERIGEQWRDGSLRIAHEHMASTIVHSFLAAGNAAQLPEPGSPLLIVTAPVRNRHELGALLAASLGLELGWEVLYLGVDLPAEEIAAAALQRSARAVFLSLIYPPADLVVATQIEQLRRLLGPGVGLLAGGAAAESYAPSLARIGAVIASTPAAFDAALKEIPR
jgi:DNA-binding transcriptional MerR regulator/methylmalonyl-CoA mutase cobalamin-binding subunit